MATQYTYSRNEVVCDDFTSPYTILYNGPTWYNYMYMTSLNYMGSL